MAYLTFADMRSASVAEFATGLTLTTAEASDANLAAAIARLSQRFDDYTNDHFEAETTTVYLSGEGNSPKLYLPQRCTAVSSVTIVDENGTQTAQTSTHYRLHSSLYASGTKRLDDDGMDYLEIVWGAGGLSGMPSSTWDPYTWPTDANSIVIAGTFGWSATPGDVKRAVALMVWDHFKSQRGDLRTAQRHSSGDVTIEVADIGRDTPTGIPEVDRIIQGYRRDSYLGVG